MSPHALTLNPGAGEVGRPPAKSAQRAAAAAAAAATAAATDIPLTAAAAEPQGRFGDAAPRRRSAGGIAIVLGLHLLLGWALLSGLAQRMVDVVRSPLETRLIEEVKPPPPLPPETLLPPPKLAPPPPSFVPPPEVNAAPPPTPAPTITTTTVAPPVTPVTIAPPPAPAAPPAPPPVASARLAGKPARIEVASCARPEYPDAAARAETVGTTKILFAVDAGGGVSRADIERPSGPTREHRLLDRAAVAALSKCRFSPGTDDNGAPVGGFAVVDYVWKLD